MRFHIVSFPHTNTTDKYSFCAFTSNVMHFSEMMSRRGHETYIYSGPENTAECTEHIPCIDQEQMPVLKPSEWPDSQYFDLFNKVTIKELETRIEPHDYICLPGGSAQKAIADAFPNHMAVEFAIGYGGTFAPFQVFASRAWQNTVYGAQSGGNSHSVRGNFYHTVIPHFFDPNQFESQEQKEDYFLFVGRLIEGKGYEIAVQVCEKLGVNLKIAGAGTPPSYGEYLGVLRPDERNEVMGKARAVFMPTLYSEPFGKVMVESFLCGTPVISTDWGSFPEINIQGLTGYRCKSMLEFTQAVNWLGDLSPQEIRESAVSRYSYDVVGPQYDEYFRHLHTLWTDGFYEGF